VPGPACPAETATTGLIGEGRVSMAAAWAPFRTHREYNAAWLSTQCRRVVDRRFRRQDSATMLVEAGREPFTPFSIALRQAHASS